MPTLPAPQIGPEAAGVIHADFPKESIKAEIVPFDDLMAAGSMQKAKEAGKLRMDGKDYVMNDGDVVKFRFGATSTTKKKRSASRSPDWDLSTPHRYGRPGSSLNSG